MRNESSGANNEHRFFGVPRAVSVIATVLNEAESIERLVRSLAAQSMRPAEIVIVDGGSTDGTWQMLERLSGEIPLLKPIRDESCNLKKSPGPIARGRNVAIRVATSDVIACADAGCSYAPDWLARLVAPITSAGAEYSLGGSAIDASQATAWDMAVAPLFGVATSAEGTRKSCTARSMAFTRAVWERAGGFPETTLLGEDTLFDLRAREFTAPAFAESAMALYAPRWTFASAAKVLARYSRADGTLGVRKSRLARMLLRCAAQIASIALLAVSWIPLAVVAVLELFFAFERDRSALTSLALAWRRIIFSATTPWIVAWNYLAGMATKRPPVNDQNQTVR